MLQFLRPVVRLNLVSLFFALTGAAAFIDVLTRSRWSSSLIALPIALGLFMRRALWRQFAVLYLGIQLLVLVGYSLFFFISHQHVTFVGPTWLSASLTEGLCVALAGAAVMLSAVALLILREPAVRELFGPRLATHAV